jgi:uncharacterized protein (TIGR03437 family)
MGGSRGWRVSICLCVSLPVLLLAYSEGPDAGNAGVPGESDCTSCHGTGGSGSVSVTFPKGLTYTPGVVQHLVVTISDPTQKRWGFQLTARKSADSTVQAGTFTPGPDGNTQLACAYQNMLFKAAAALCVSHAAQYPLQYIDHTQPGTRNGTLGSITFEFDWTPPATNMGNIGVYVSANAANGDTTDRGDHIYLKSYTLTPAGQTAPTISGVVNGASFQSGFSPGSWVTIAGANLATTSRTWTAAEVATGALPTQLDGVNVTINGKASYVYYISPTQLDVQAPSDTAAGPVVVQLTNASGAATFTGQMLYAQPAFFLWGGKYPVATRTDYSYVAPTGLFAGVATVPAKPGDTLILWGTGFGPTTPATAAGQVVKGAPVLANPVSVTIGGLAATIYGVALSPGSVGLYQIALQVPVALADGDQSVVAQLAGASSPSGVVLSVKH